MFSSVERIWVQAGLLSTWTLLQLSDATVVDAVLSLLAALCTCGFCCFAFLLFFADELGRVFFCRAWWVELSQISWLSLCSLVVTSRPHSYMIISQCRSSWSPVCRFPCECPDFLEWVSFPGEAVLISDLRHFLIITSCLSIQASENPLGLTFKDKSAPPRLPSICPLRHCSPCLSALITHLLWIQTIYLITTGLLEPRKKENNRKKPSINDIRVQYTCSLPLLTFLPYLSSDDRSLNNIYWNKTL